MALVRSALDGLGIPYSLYDHPPVFTAEEAARHWADIPATGVKNLFLRNRKGDRHYLVLLGLDRQADLKELVSIIGDDRLSFGSPDRLKAQLGLTPGSVSPFGLLHNDGGLIVVIDAALRGAGRLIFHPNINTASLSIAVADFERFLATRRNPVRWVRIAGR
ncbi:MAG TPA: prolyl-tRNA synthetase associated domain-containing protein [Vicinamibacterales bacterium]|nr:prolyl-tRNA synthetase associated domain-containing protein [Vicinamibacterales bacterium]